MEQHSDQDMMALTVLFFCKALKMYFCQWAWGPQMINLIVLLLPWVGEMGFLVHC